MRPSALQMSRMLIQRNPRHPCIVVHDWDDAPATAILKTIRRAAGPTSRLLIAGRVGQVAALLELEGCWRAGAGAGSPGKADAVLQA